MVAMKTQPNANEIIDALGGTSETARLCEVEPPSVSEWRINGIPNARLMFLKLARPDVFAKASRNLRVAKTGRNTRPKTRQA